jgi:putative intracellular protease/amidase
MTAVKDQIVADHHMRVDAVSSMDALRDPRDQSKWSSEDVVTMGANYVQGGPFRAFVVRDGRLITGQQQYSGRKVAQALIEALGI